MKTFEITLEIESRKLSLDQIAAIVGVEGSPYSHSMGDQRGKTSSWDMSVWKTPPVEVDNTDIDACLLQLLSQPVMTALQTKRDELDGSRALINVAVFHDSVDCSLTVDSGVLKRVGDMGLDLAISCYPCE